MDMLSLIVVFIAAVQTFIVGHTFIFVLSLVFYLVC